MAVTSFTARVTIGNAVFVAKISMTECDYEEYSSHEVGAIDHVVTLLREQLSPLRDLHFDETNIELFRADVTKVL